MPFYNSGYREFTRSEIESIHPNQYGVYGIFRHDAWIYVGRGDLRTRLLSHVNGENPMITKERPTHFVAEVTSHEVVREKALIAELRPLANQKIG